MHVLVRVDEDQIGFEVFAEFQEIFQNFLPRVREDAGGEGSQDDAFSGDAEDCHRAKMLVFHILQVGILLVVRERDTQNIRLLDDVMQKAAASQFNIIWVRAEKKDAFAEEVHGW